MLCRIFYCFALADLFLSLSQVPKVQRRIECITLNTQLLCNCCKMGFLNQHSNVSTRLFASIQGNRDYRHRWANWSQHSCVGAELGRPLTPREQKRVWEHGYRSEEAQRLRPEGAGWGLSIVKENILDQGGDVGVESEYTSGTTFWFELPITSKRL